MAYPYSLADDFDVAAQRAVADAGMTATCSSVFGRDRSDERFELRRVSVESQDSLETVGLTLDGGYDWIVLKEPAAVGLRLSGLMS